MVEKVPDTTLTCLESNDNLFRILGNLSRNYPLTEQDISVMAFASTGGRLFPNRESRESRGGEGQYRQLLPITQLNKPFPEAFPRLHLSTSSITLSLLQSPSDFSLSFVMEGGVGGKSKATLKRTTITGN